MGRVTVGRGDANARKLVVDVVAKARCVDDVERDTSALLLELCIVLESEKHERIC
jgi:predicted mannosyl-3-phosphoglycerate phosphatase (HAD superfamily)